MNDNFTRANTLLNDSDFLLVPSNVLLKVDWIIPVTVHILLIGINIWILLSLLYYGRKTKRWNRTKKKSSDQFNMGAIYTSVVGCATVCLVYIISNLVYINVGFYPDSSKVCDSMADAVVGLYAFVLMSVGVFLWLRQRTFYNNFLLNADFSKCIRVFSSTSIVLIIGGGLCALVINTIPNDHIWSPDGCLYRPDNDLRIAYWVSIVVAILFGQSTLLGLFIYALKQSQSESSNTNDSFSGDTVNDGVSTPYSGATPSRGGVATSKQSIPSTYSARRNRFKSTSQSSYSQADKQAKAVHEILKKTFIFAVLSTLSDIFFQVFIHYLTDPQGNRRISITLGTLNAFVHLIFMILSFVKCKTILTSLCCSLLMSDQELESGRIKSSTR